MIRPLLFVAVMSVILMGGVQESALVSADTPDPNDLCTFTLKTETSEYVEFLGTGGGGGPRDEYCPMGYGPHPDTDAGVDGPEDYFYLIYVIKAEDEDAARGRVSVGNDQFTATNLGSVGSETVVGQGGEYAAAISHFARGRYYVRGQAGIGRGSSIAGLHELLAYVDDQIRIVLGDAPEPAADVDGGDADPGDADAGPPGDPAFVDVILGTAGLAALQPRIEELTRCPPSKYDPIARLVVEPSAADCPGQRPGLVVAVRFEREFDERVPDYSVNEKEMKDQLSVAMRFAGMEGPGGEPLFPSFIAAMPVIKRLANMSRDPDAPDQTAAAYAKREERALRAVGRFMELLAAQDAAQWDKRFP